jgi:hypothetical protein
MTTTKTSPDRIETLDAEVAALEGVISHLSTEVTRLQRMIRHLVALTVTRPGAVDIDHTASHRRALLEDLRVIEQHLGYIQEGDNK